MLKKNLNVWAENQEGLQTWEVEALANRLSGGNSYCLTEWRPGGILHTTRREGERTDNCRLQYPSTSTRYDAVNFNAVHKYGTVEFRMLPIFTDVEHSLSAMKVLLLVVTYCIRRTRHKLRGSESTTIRISNGVMIEEVPSPKSIRHIIDLVAVERDTLLQNAARTRGLEIPRRVEQKRESVSLRTTRGGV